MSRPAIRVTVDLPAGASMVWDKKDAVKVWRDAGRQIVSAAKAKIGAGSGRVYRLDGGGHYTASAPGQGPANRTGKLKAAVRVKALRGGFGLRIFDDVSGSNGEFYSRFMEGGSRGGGGDTHNRANILLAGETNWRGKVLRGQNRMKASAINQSRVQQPRPFISTAVAERWPSLRDQVRVALVQGIALKVVQKSGATR